MRILAPVAPVVGCCILLASMPAHADEAEGGESKVPAYVGTSLTAAFLVTSVVSYFGYQAALKDRRDKFGAQREDWFEAADRAERWRTIGLVSVGGTIIAGGITGYLWTRTEKAPQHFRVTADPDGASAWVSGSF
jgi:hypothetical protein